MNEMHGGSPYGAGELLFLDFNTIIWIIWFFTGTYAGADGSRKPSNLELKVAEHQGTHFTQITTALKVGRAALSSDPKQK